MVFGSVRVFQLELAIHIFRIRMYPVPAGRVFQYRVRSGRVLDKIPGSGSGSGRAGVLKYTIGYFWVPYLISGIPGHF